MAETKAKQVESKKETNQPKKSTSKQSTSKFSKEQLLESEKISPVQKDFLSVILEDGKQYSIKEAQQELEKTMKGVVK